MTKFPFTKMHGLGNCFILMDDTASQVSKHTDLGPLSEKVCDRNFGIGADGLILIQSSDKADFKMRIFNEDGSEAEMCGNGIRCLAKFAVSQGLSKKDKLSFETLAGLINTRLIDDGSVEVDMGEPILINEDVKGSGEPIVVIEESREFTFVSMGNPHAITFVDDFEFDWRSFGEKVEHSTSFPNKTNVEFVKILNENEVQMRVWERGCGETLACGTGACAVSVACALHEKLPRAPVTVHLAGGPLLLYWNENNRVMMTGPAITVCQGTYLY